jgi:monofunctional glycosyltransferase
MLRLASRVLLLFVIGVAVFYGFALIALVWLRFLPPATTMVQVQRRIEAVAAGGSPTLDTRWVAADRISPHLRHAVVAAEDTRFFDHGGFDRDCIREQRRVRAGGGSPRGCSTITQQLVKNLFLTTHRSWVRKGVEASLTPPAEWILGKDRILTLYLNVIEWGPAVFGAEAAARHHYSRAADALTREQAASLAAVIPAPRTRDPRRMDRYRGIILRRMTQMGW